MKKSSLSLPSLSPLKKSRIQQKQQHRMTIINLKTRFECNFIVYENIKKTQNKHRVLLKSVHLFNIQNSYYYLTQNILNTLITQIKIQIKTPTNPPFPTHQKASFLSDKQTNHTRTKQSHHYLYSVHKNQFSLHQYLNKYNHKYYSTVNHFKKQTNFAKKEVLFYYTNTNNKYIETYQKSNILQKLKKLQSPAKNNKIKISITASKTPIKQTKQTQQINLSINYHILQSNLTKPKPYIDYDAMNFSLGKYGYFYAGRKQLPMVVYDRAENQWRQVQIDGVKPFGESCPTLLNQQEKEVIFFGGIRFYQPGVSLFMNDIQILNLKFNKNRIIKFSQSIIPPRAFHASCIYGQFLLVNGGIDKNYKTLNSFYVYNYVKNYWNQLQITKMPQRLKTGISKHKILPLIHKRSRYLIYQQTPIIEPDIFLHEGIYIFGGQDINIQLSNNLYLLKLGQTQLQISQLFPKGSAPLSRKNFTFSRLTKKYLLIHGGRNDQMNPFTLDSFHFLDVTILEWIQVKGDKSIGRYSHGLIINGDKEIVIFGGKNHEGICKEIYAIQFEQEIVKNNK